jgi:hypothetical protein
MEKQKENKIKVRIDREKKIVLIQQGVNLAYFEGFIFPKMTAAEKRSFTIQIKP